MHNGVEGKFAHKPGTLPAAEVTKGRKSTSSVPGTHSVFFSLFPQWGSLSSSLRNRGASGIKNSFPHFQVPGVYAQAAKPGGLEKKHQPATLVVNNALVIVLGGRQKTKEQRNGRRSLLICWQSILSLT